MLGFDIVELSRHQAEPQLEDHDKRFAHGPGDLSIKLHLRHELSPEAQLGAGRSRPARTGNDNRRV